MPVGVLVWRVGPAGCAALVPLLALVTFRARVVVRTTAWATLPTALAVRTGWWTRRTRVVRYAKMQVVSTTASPFDRRARMARLHVDVAAAGAAALGIPWLDREVADALLARLSREAERTRFRW